MSYRRTPVTGRTVVLQARRTGSTTWTSINHRVSAVKTGTVTFTLTQTGRNEQYRLVSLAGAGYAAGTSAIITIKRA